MAGYVHQPKVFKLTFADDHQFAGLELRTRPGSMRDYADFVRELAAIEEATKAAGNPGTRLTEQAARLDVAADHFDAIRELFAGRLLSWNWEDPETGPVPATLEGLATLDDDTLVDLVEAWMDATTDVSDDLGKGSSPGETARAMEASLPMEPLPPSLAS